MIEVIFSVNTDRQMLAKRAVQCNEWRLMMRMRVFDDSGTAHTIVGFEELDGSPILCNDETADIGHFDADELAPDLDDHATLGCIEHGMLPAAWPGHRIEVHRHADGTAEVVVRAGVLGMTEWCSGTVASVGEALVRCLEAAPHG